MHTLNRNLVTTAAIAVLAANAVHADVYSDITTGALEFPVRYHATMDTRRWGPGERLVFEPYTKEAFEASREWIATHEIFPREKLVSGLYEQAIKN